MITGVHVRGISIHAPSRERRFIALGLKQPSYFNPRSLTGATARGSPGFRRFPISIHAPSRERPGGALPEEPGLRISIHAPSRERPLPLFIFCIYSYFNPRSLTGATQKNTADSAVAQNFNPRSLTGATINFTFEFGVRIFQSTLPHGSDQTLAQAILALLNFNPRSLTGATILVFASICPATISIHAPSRERQLYLPSRNPLQDISIHAPSRERHRNTNLSIIVGHFNPRSLTGATAGAGGDFV